MDLDQLFGLVSLQGAHVVHEDSRRVCRVHEALSEHTASIDLVEHVGLNGNPHQASCAAANLLQLAVLRLLAAERSKPGLVYFGHVTAGQDDKYRLQAAGKMTFSATKTTLAGFEPDQVRECLETLGQTGWLGCGDVTTLQSLIPSSDNVCVESYARLCTALNRRSQPAWTAQQVLAGEKDLPHSRRLVLCEQLVQHGNAKLTTFAVVHGQLTKVTLWVVFHFEGCAEVNAADVDNATLLFLDGPATYCDALRQRVLSSGQAPNLPADQTASGNAVALLALLSDIVCNHHAIPLAKAFDTLLQATQDLVASSPPELQQQLSALLVGLEAAGNDRGAIQEVIGTLRLLVTETTALSAPPSIPLVLAKATPNTDTPASPTTTLI
eukprot:m.103095 g.103095  ORF g.103095 m.103095 type:complete len:382 (-) comp15556_c0_seq6:34-1179(-)